MRFDRLLTDVGHKRGHIGATCMPWQPDAHLEEAVDKILARARDRTAVWSQYETARVQEKAAGQGGLFFMASR
jgi:hypothetical protein